MSWSDLESADPELAAFGADRLRHSGVAYLATVRAAGAPRVHPVTPIIGRGRLFLFMEPSSPKGNDLRREPRYALHCSVGDMSGAGGEFYVSGRARFSEDPADRAAASELSGYEVAERYILFELDVEEATSNVYGATPQRRRWRRPA